MMKYFSFFRTANKAATLSTLISLIALFIKIVCLNPLPSATAQIYDLGVVVDAILTSVIASYIFYLFSVHLKEVRDKQLLSPYLDGKTYSVIGGCEMLLAELGKQTGVVLTLEKIDGTILKDALSKISFQSSAPLMIGSVQANWYQYFEYQEANTKDAISRLLARMTFLEPEFIVLLDAIQESSHIKIGSTLRDFLLRNPDLSAYAGTLVHYCKQCLALKDYMKESKCP